MKQLLIAAALALAAVCASAQVKAPEPCSCHPEQDDADYLALDAGRSVLNTAGPWVRYFCAAKKGEPIAEGTTEIPLPKPCVIAQPWASVVNGVAYSIDLGKVGDRWETVRKAPDRMAAFRASWKRHVLLPLSDPSLAAVVANMNATLLQR